jgi:hypothetical protein
MSGKTQPNQPALNRLVSNHILGFDPVTFSVLKAR